MNRRQETDVSYFTENPPKEEAKENRSCCSVKLKSLKMQDVELTKKSWISDSWSEISQNQNMQ